MFLGMMLTVVSNANWLSVPEMKNVITVAVMAVTISGTIEAMVRSSIRTSRVNSTPVMGALKMPATAPVAPQPTNNISFFWSRRNSLPKFEPIAEPVRTIGASAPTEPPNPMVSELATTDDHMLCAFMIALLREMAYMIFVTPWLMSSFTIYLTKELARNIPTIGVAKKR